MAENKCENRLLSLLSAQEWHLDRVYAEYSRQFAFIFSNHNGNITKLQKRQLEKTLAKFHDEIEKTMAQQIQSSFSISDLCNNDLAESYLKGMEVPEGQMSRIFKTNPGAVTAFLSRKAGGLNLSQRVWNLTNQTEESLLNVLETGIFNGRPAADMARDLQQYLKEPNKRFRRIRNEEGKLILSNPAKDYHPGQGVYRSSYKNALRLSRNEVNIAYRTNDHSRRQNMSFVMGQRIQLSAAHPALCICDHMVGTYPKEYFFTGFHTNCLCFSTSILLPREKFKEYLGGSPIDKRHLITNIPKGAQDYLNANADKLRGLSSKPYFLKDNFKYSNGQYVPMLKAAPYQIIPAQTRSLIETPKIQSSLIKDVPGLASTLSEFAVINPQMFVRGFRSMQVTSRRGVNGFTDMNGNIALTKPIIDDVIDGINNIKSGVPATLQQETALSTLNHEIWHNANKVGNINLTKLQTRYMELSNEFVARNRLPEFMEKLGGKLQNKSLMVDRSNTGYNTMVRNFDKLIELSKADKKSLLEDVEKYLINGSYKSQDQGLIDAIVKHSKVKITKLQARQLIKGATQYDENGFANFLQRFQGK